MLLRVVLLITLAGCHRNDPTDTTSDTDDTDGAETGAPWWQAEAQDADGDGFSVAQGDCDDADPSAYPRGPEVCDGRDNDCDGQTDEQTAADAWEPNDGNAGSLGDLTGESELVVFGFLHPASDIDRYSFYLEDEDLGYFDIEAWLYGVPLDADYQIELLWTEDAGGISRGSVGFSDETGAGGYEVVDYPGVSGGDDSGTYEVVVRSSSGSGCASPYTLHLLLGGL